MLKCKTSNPPFADLSQIAVEPSRVDVWATNSARTQVQYRILAEAEPDILCRLLGYFAQQLLIPQQVSAQQLHEEILIEVQQADISLHRAEVIAQKMRSLTSVCSVELKHVAELPQRSSLSRIECSI
ncbi:MAG: hypothetical protein ACRERX_00320 [Pseudomonas sp.]